MRSSGAPTEFELASAYLADKPDGTKLSRKRCVGDLIFSNSFIKIEGAVYRIIRKTLGSGTYSRVKLIERNGQFFAMKVSNGPKQKRNYCLDEEVSIEAELGLLVARAKRTDSEKELRVLPYLGKNLLDCRSRFNGQEAISIALQSVQEVIDLHAGKKSQKNKAYLHRDIKPENFMIDDNGQVKMVDFGFAVRKPEKWLQAVVCGTSGYIAPEAYKGKFSVATDIYALGVMIYDLLPKNLVSLLNIARLMWAHDPDLRPSLELVKLALLVQKSIGVSHECLEQILIENDAEIQSPEDAIVFTAVLANSTIRNRFSDPENFGFLVTNQNLRIMILRLSSSLDLQASCFSLFTTIRLDQFLNPNSELHQSFRRLMEENQANPKNIYRLLKYPSFMQCLISDNPNIEQLCKFFCEIVYKNDFEFLRSLLLDEGELFLRIRALGCFNDALSDALASAISQRKFALAVELILFGAESDESPEVIFLLAIAGELNLITRLINYNPLVLNAVNHNGENLLMFAASRGYDELVSYLIAQSAVINLRNECQNKPKTLGNTALFYALDQAKWSTAKILMRAGADPNLNGAQDVSPLFRCLQQENYAMAAFCLFYGAKLDFQARKILMENKNRLIAGIHMLLRSEICADAAGAERGLALLRKLGVIKSEERDDDLFSALFGGCCFALFKPANFCLLEKLAESLGSKKPHHSGISP